MYMEYLWATSRSTWVKHPRVKFTGCIFCGIAKGDKKIPSKVLYKDPDMMVIMNIFPYNVGHIQVVPIRHIRSLDEMTEDEFNKFFRMGKKCLMFLRKALNPAGFNVGINLGEVAGASIEHIHMQIVPRYNREVGFMETTAHTKVMPESLEQTHKKLMKFVDLLKD
jgi:diadenosine tetraphosphate (Ap4A) HIT family hydrolase